MILDEETILYQLENASALWDGFVPTGGLPGNSASKIAGNRSNGVRPLRDNLCGIKIDLADIIMPLDVIEIDGVRNSRDFE
jgi:hypothetical protein